MIEVNWIMSKTPFANIKVIDFGCYLAGPLAGLLLADQGLKLSRLKITKTAGSIESLYRTSC
jgi:crotonobetainyl-CoA:carnitine CoA-transferase CaiB-like acyl-CoA transferase